MGVDSVASTKYKSLATIARELGHARIDLLKMDIEGYEYGVFESLFAPLLRSMLAGSSASSMHLPFQISFELHYGSLAFDGAVVPRLSIAHLGALWVELSELGYVVVSREDNPLCTHCAEFTIVRAFC